MKHSATQAIRQHKGISKAASVREFAFPAHYEYAFSAKFREDALANPKAFPTEYGFRDVGIKLKEVNVITKYPTIRTFLDSPERMWRRFPEVAAGGNLPEIYSVTTATSSTS